MTEILPFGDALVRARRSQGYASAHAFFTGCGGPRALGLSFAAYLALEHGKSVPKPARLKSILRALKLLKGSPLRVGLLRAYLDSLFEDDELASELTAQPSGRPEPGGRPAEEASRMIMRQSVNLDLSHWELIARDYDAYLCDYFIQCTSGYLAIEEIARSTGLSAVAAKAAVKRLAAAGVVELNGDRVRGPYAERLINIPPLSPATAALYASLRKNRDRMIRSGERVHDSCIVGRVPADALDRYARYLMETIDTAAVYCDAGEASADVYAVEARITRVLRRQPEKTTRRREDPAAGVSERSLVITE
jgi:hypothetical protein